MLLVCTSLCVSAQWKIGRLNRDLTLKTSTWDFDCDKGEYVGFTENRNGTINIFILGAEGMNYEFKNLPAHYKNYIQFTGFYKVSATDPVDNYVNVRKGQGTKYPVVGKVKVDSNFFVKELENNWVKVYGAKFCGEDRDDDGFFYDVGNGVDPYVEWGYNVFFLGYIHKSRIKTPVADIYDYYVVDSDSKKALGL